MQNPFSLPHKRYCFRQRFLCGVTALAVALVITGCGGSGQKQISSVPNAFPTVSTNTTSGRAVLRVAWPEVATSRLIPAVTAALQLRVSGGPTSVPPILIPRGTVESKTPLLSPGNYLVSVTALPSADGSGTPLALRADVPLTIVAGGETPVEVVLQSTITRLEVSGPRELAAGDSADFGVIARNAVGEAVLCDPQAFLWSLPSTERCDLEQGASSRRGGRIRVSGRQGGDSEVALTVRYQDQDFTLTQDKMLKIKPRGYGVFDVVGLPGDDAHRVTGRLATDGTYLYMTANNTAFAGRCHTSPDSVFGTNTPFARHEILRYTIDRSNPAGPQLSGALYADLAKASATDSTNPQLGDIAHDGSGGLFVVIDGQVRYGHLAAKPGNPTFTHVFLNYVPNADFNEDVPAWSPDANVVNHVSALSMVGGSLYALSVPDGGRTPVILKLNPSSGAVVSQIAVPSGFAPTRLTADGRGTVFLGGFATSGNVSTILRLDEASGRSSILTNLTLTLTDLRASDDGRLLYVADTGDVRLFDAASGLPISASGIAGLQKPTALAIDASGWAFTLDDVNVGSYFFTGGNPEEALNLARVKVLRLN